MATTMLGFLDIEGCIDYAIDGNPHKHGWWTPGSHLLIVPPDRLREDPPDNSPAPLPTAPDAVPE